MKLRSLKTVIRTKDFKASVKFYFRLLELNIIEQFSGSNCGYILQFGEQESNGFIELSEILPTHAYYLESFSEPVTSDKIDIQLRTDDVVYWADKFKGSCPFRGPVPRPWGSIYLYIRDPDGLQIITEVSHMIYCCKRAVYVFLIKLNEYVII